MEESGKDYEKGNLFLQIEHAVKQNIDQKRDVNIYKPFDWKHIQGKHMVKPLVGICVVWKEGAMDNINNQKPWDDPMKKLYYKEVEKVSSF